jgi:tetratricopeptide (TPR) repeat protein
VVRSVTTVKSTDLPHFDDACSGCGHANGCAYCFRVTPREDEIEELIEEWDVTLAPGERLPLIEELLERLSPGAPGRTVALTYRGEILHLLDRREEAVAAFELATAEGGTSTIDPRVLLLETLFELGRDQEAETLLEQLRAASATGDVRGSFHSWIGDLLEDRGDLKRAHRWFNLGLRDLDPELDEPDFAEEDCLLGRQRVREQLGLPRDRFDLLTDGILARRREKVARWT